MNSNKLLNVTTLTALPGWERLFVDRRPAWTDV